MADDLTSALDQIRERFESVTEIPLESLPLEPEQAAEFAALVMDVPPLLAAIEAAAGALERHMHHFTERDGTEVCGGCLNEYPCPDAGIITSALSGTQQGEGESHA